MFAFAKKPKPPFVSAVIVAAGTASRMNGLDKQLAVIDEIPVVVRSLLCFEECSAIREILVVCREEQVLEYYRMVQEYALKKVASVVKGGAHRQESVFCGVAACSKEAQFFAIHDGARPFVTDWEIGACIDAAMRYGAAATGVPVKDTIKICDAQGFVQSTPEREGLVAITTPQVFAAELYREGMQKAKERHCVYTDDCQLIERCGRQVFVSPGSYENIKITVPEDLVHAQAILAYREQGADLWREFE